MKYDEQIKSIVKINRLYGLHFVLYCLYCLPSIYNELEVIMKTLFNILYELTKRQNVRPENSI